MSESSEILGKLLSSETTAELLVLFHKNPGLIDTLDGVARKIGRLGPDIESAVRDLEGLGVLQRKTIGKSEVISLDRVRDNEIQSMVAEHLKSLKPVKSG